MHLLENCQPQHEEVAQKLKSSFYVDNCVSGVFNTDEQGRFIEHAKLIMLNGCFNLRGFESNVAGKTVDRSSGDTSVLGVIWNLETDTLKCCTDMDTLTCETKITKRLILAIVQGIFDPIGLLTPATLLPKLLIQHLWKMKIAWDSELSPKDVNVFLKWFRDLYILKDVTLSRCMIINSSSELHVFVDASKEAYAACVFVRSMFKSDVKVILVLGETPGESEEVELERKKLKVVNIDLSRDAPPWHLYAISDYNKMIRVFSWILRFVNNCTLLNGKCKDSELSQSEIENSEKKLIRLVQSYYLPDAKSSNYIETYIDDEGIFLRVKTKILNRDDERSFLYPILLPEKCELTKLLIRDVHKKNCHAGIQMMQCLLREIYSIIRARKAIKIVLYNCITCKCFKVKSMSSEPTPLPPDRVTDCAPFEIVGIDFAGPLFLKDGRKVWITLFTCAVYRAIHLELVNSLTSDAFLLALRCFIARRGRPRTIYCDNRTNFRGAFNDLSKLNWSKIVEETRTPKILWKFIPPTAAWWGGWWKGWSALPLTYVSENPEELIPLTPNMFLISNKNSNIEDIEELNSNSLNKRIKYRSKLLKDLRQRFRNEYLSQLIQKHNEKESRDPQIGEVVLVGDDNKKRLFWALAKIIELIPGRDGKIRTVRLKTQHGKMLRPIQSIYPLEIRSNKNLQRGMEESITTVSETLSPDEVIFKKYTSSGRCVKKPKRDWIYLIEFVMCLRLFASLKGEDVAK
ncbi:integrase catalytic domain-containing protein [Trichonephila clavipes]|nr:integrase catalytic domain-containing protein [Trichonephila clavipes]